MASKDCPFRMANPKAITWACQEEKCAWFVWGACAMRQLTTTADQYISLREDGKI